MTTIFCCSLGVDMFLVICPSTVETDAMLQTAIMVTADKQHLKPAGFVRVHVEESPSPEDRVGWGGYPKAARMMVEHA